MFLGVMVEGICMTHLQDGVNALKQSTDFLLKNLEFLYWFRLSPRLAIFDPDIIKEVLINMAESFEREVLGLHTNLIQESLLVYMT